MGTTQTITIIDNFYSDPETVRTFALASPYSISGNFPGKRTLPLLKHSQIQAKIQSYVQFPITYWENEYNGAFQYTTLAESTWIHSDAYTDYAGVLFLTPNAPTNSGTVFYKHIASGYHNEPKDKALHAGFNFDGNDLSMWEQTDKVANIYNRLVLYDASKWHRSENYFGDNINNGRLFQVFFFCLQK
jgi:hypothetical protein